MSFVGSVWASFHEQVAVVPANTVTGAGAGWAQPLVGGSKQGRSSFTVGASDPASCAEWDTCRSADAEYATSSPGPYFVGAV